VPRVRSVGCVTDRPAPHAAPQPVAGVWGSALGTGIGVGVGIGTALGAALGNIAVGVSLGLGLGAVLASAYAVVATRRRGESVADDGEPPAEA
jgi:hypothetical protein